MRLRNCDNFVTIAASPPRPGSAMAGRVKACPRRLLGPLLLLVGCLPPSVGAQTYHITYLGALSASHDSAAVSLNERGDAAGFSRAGAESRAFLFTPDGKMTDLGVLRGYAGSEAVAVNDSGQVAGFSTRTQETETVSQAFVRKGRRLEGLGFLTGANSSEATDLNNNGVVVGESGGVAFSTANNRLRNLGTLPGEATSRAGAINNLGVIAGNSGRRLFRTNAGNLADLGIPQNAVALEAKAINADNEIVGFYRVTEDGPDQAFRQASGVFTNLGDLTGAGAIAWDINNGGQIVGTSGGRAFLFQSGTMTDLNTLVTLATTGEGFTELTRALAINESGEIAGEGRYRDAGGVLRLRAFLLTPIPANSAAAPVISPATGGYQSTVIVQITNSGTTGVVRYTTNGSDPTETSPVYAGPFIVESSRSIKARTFVPELAPSPVSLARYTIIPALTTTALPVVTPSAGTYPQAVTITMSCPTQDALIRYTINGSDPNVSSNPYTEPFVLRSSATVKARAFSTGRAPSPVTAVPYVVTATNPNFVATPSIRPEPGLFETSVRVRITSATTTATIFYTLDGSDPTTVSTKYTGPFTVSETTTVKARAYSGPHPSEIATALYTKIVPEPSPTPTPEP
jgi:probable HAF family extracellular repeat protein